MKCTEPFEVDLATLQPSQLYICDEKLAKVELAMRGDTVGRLEPVPIKRLGSRVVLTDGHTRAFAAYRHGRKTILACWEDEDLDWDAYEICVAWCLEQGIHTIVDLQTQVVGAREYEELWYARCRAMQETLAAKRERES